MSIMDGDKGARLVFSGMRWIILFNVVQRLTTFVLNQSMISWTSPEIFGMAAISLELLLSSLLFLSREGIRLACLRETIVTADQRQLVVNLSWIPSIILLATLILFSSFRLEITNIFSAFKELDFDVILMYSSGALFEVLGEPWVNIFQSAALYQPRLRADTVAVFVRSVVTFVTVVTFSMGIRGFGYAQLAYGASHFLTLLSSTRSFEINGVPSTLSDFMPRVVVTNGNVPIVVTELSDCANQSCGYSRIIDLRTAGVAFSATLSSLLKHLLTEADKIALSLTSSTYNQGIFAVSSNYGSLVARMIFLPIEESSRTAFSKMASELASVETLVVEQTSPLSTDEAKVENSIGLVRLSPHDSNFDKLAVMEDLLVRLVQIVSTLGVAFLIFGPLYSRIVVRLIFSRDYQGEESVHTLAAVCVNVFVLALNGVMEAFVHAAAPPAAFKRINMGYVISSVVYIVAVGPLIQALGTCGLVAAGSLSMGVRILSSYSIITSFLTSGRSTCKDSKEQSTGTRILGAHLRSQCCPPLRLLAACAGAWVLSYASSQRFFLSPKGIRNVLEHIAVGGVALLILLGTILTTITDENLQYLLKIARLRRQKET